MTQEDVYLWRFYWDCGRSGDVEGLFVASEREVNEAIGKDVDFGETLGKHSDVRGVLEEGDLEKMNISPDSVREVSVHLGTTWSGYNPLDYVYLKCDECGEQERADEGYIHYHEPKKQYLCVDCVKEILEIPDEE